MVVTAAESIDQIHVILIFFFGHKYTTEISISCGTGIDNWHRHSCTMYTYRTWWNVNGFDVLVWPSPMSIIEMDGVPRMNEITKFISHQNQSVNFPSDFCDSSRGVQSLLAVDGTINVRFTFLSDIWIIIVNIRILFYIHREKKGSDSSIFQISHCVISGQNIK